MGIYSVKGNIFEVGPKVAEAVAVWLRNGFNQRAATWEAARRAYTERGVPDHPWLERKDPLFPDSLFPLHTPIQPDLRWFYVVRWLYVFANPGDGHGYPNLAAVHQAVDRCLTRLAEAGARSVAMMHIPLASAVDGPAEDEDFLPGTGLVPAPGDDSQSAQAMVEELRAWGAAHPGINMDVFLIDLRGDFNRVV